MSVSLRVWNFIQSAKARATGLADDRGVSDMVAVLILIAIVLMIGLAVTPVFRDAVVEQFSKITDSLRGIESMG